MGIYDREYYRERTSGSGWLSGAAPACKAIILLNVALWILPKFAGDSSAIERWFAAYSGLIFEKLQIWRLVTAAFLHSPDNIWHLVFNMLFLWMVGREMEAFYGTREFWWLYLSAAAVSTLCWAALDYPKSINHPMLGASGAVLTVVSLYTFYYPRREVILFIFPVEMWVVLAFYVVSDALQLLNRSTEPVAFAAHLGGFAYAVAFKQFDLRLSRLKALLPKRGPKLRIVAPDPPPREAPAIRPSSPPQAGSGTGPAWSPGPVTSTRVAPTVVVPQELLDAKLDEILVKIAREGRDGLTDEEKQILDEASRRAKSRRGERI